MTVPQAIPIKFKPKYIPRNKSKIIFIQLINKTNLNTNHGLLLPNKIPSITKFIKVAGDPNILILIYDLVKFWINKL